MTFQDESTIAALGIAERAGAPVLSWNQGHPPIVFAEGFPPLELDDMFEAELAGEVAAAPRQDADLGGRESTKRGFVKVIKVGVGEQNEVDGWQIPKA